MIINSLIITVIGMGFVLAFLGILVLAMQLLSFVIPMINKIIPEPMQQNAAALECTDAALAAVVALAWYNSARSEQ